MKKYGLIVAVEEEALKQRLGDGYDLADDRGTVLYQTGRCQLYALRCGAGEIYAASATQFLIDRYGVEAIINYGVVGACSDEIGVGETCLVSGVAHYQYDLSAVDNVPVGRHPEYPERLLATDSGLLAKALDAVPELRCVICASGDMFVDSAEDKLWLHDEFGADICDMEAAGILLTCDSCRVPCLLIKTVSDGVSGGAEEYWQEKDGSASECLDAATLIFNAL